MFWWQTEWREMKGGGQWTTFSDPWSSRRNGTCRCWPWSLMTLAPRNRVDALFFVLIMLMIDQCRMSGNMSCALCGCPRTVWVGDEPFSRGRGEAWGTFICTGQSWVCTASLCLTLRREAVEQLPCQVVMGPTLSSHCLVIMAHRSNYSGRTNVASRADDGVGKLKLPSLWCVPTIHTSHSIFCVKLARIWRTATYQKAGKLTVLTEVITETDVIFFKGALIPTDSTMHRHQCPSLPSAVQNSVLLMLSQWRILFHPFLLMAGIELEIILHLWIPQAQFLMSQCVKTPASFSNRQGCDGGSSEAFRHVAEASHSVFCLREEGSYGWGFHSPRESTHLYKKPMPVSRYFIVF